MSDYSILKKTFIYSIKLAWKASKTLSALYIVVEFIKTVLPLANIYVLGSLLNNLIDNATFKSLKWDIIMFISFTIFIRIIGEVSNYVLLLLNQRISHEYDMEFAQKLDELPLSFFDSSEGKDLIDELSYVKGSAISFYKKVILIFSALYAFIIAFMELIEYNVLFSVLFIVLTIPGIIIEHIFDKKNETLRREKAPDVRKFSYYKWMLLDKYPAKDVRMYNLSEELRKRYNEEKDAYLDANKKIDRQKMGYAVVAELIKRSGEMFFIAFVIREAIKGNVNIGNVTLYIGFALSISNTFQNVAENVVEMMTISIDEMKCFFRFFDYPCNKREMEFRHVSDFESLKFKNVFFKYPTQDEYILKGVTFTLNKGDRLSIVGVNGAGKTTIIKLMLGLYEINSGEILLNGYSISEYYIDEVHALFSVMFQRFAQYPLTLRENITLSAAYRMTDNEGIISAMKQSAIFQQYKENLEDFLTKQFDDNGIELSRGQWQKIALARTFFKDSPVMVFDEPSAALDVEAEDYILRNYCGLSERKTGVMISHRIYGAKYSTRIIVLNDGKIIEDGTHNELVNLNGFYAKLFNMQKEKYSYGGEINEQH